VSGFEAALMDLDKLDFFAGCQQSGRTTPFGALAIISSHG
jgi:hypothetical protein